MAKREYIQANKDWLEAKAKEQGVKALPKGIYYKVLSEGNHGKFSQPGIPGGSTLIFEIELLGIA